jgi:hypothetical protein
MAPRDKGDGSGSSVNNPNLMLEDPLLIASTAPLALDDGEVMDGLFRCLRAAADPASATLAAPHARRS